MDRITKSNLLSHNTDCLSKAHTDRDGWYDTCTYNWCFSLGLDVIMGEIYILNTNWFKGNKIQQLTITKR